MKTTLLKIKLCFTLFVLIAKLGAQNTMVNDTLFCNYIGQNKGLLQLNIKGQTLDELGYLWLGTEDGLHRFNGYEFKYFLNNPKDSISIPDDHLRDLLHVNDTLWVATNSKGIVGYSLKKNNFFELQLKENVTHNTSYKVFKLNTNFLLFAVKNYALIYNRKTKEIKELVLPNSSLETYVTDVLSIQNNEFWLGTSTSGVLKLNLETLQLTNASLFSENKDIRFLRMQEHIYVGTKEGLLIYDPKSNDIKTSPLSSSINCLFKLNKDEAYIGSEFGLYKYNHKTSQITSYALKTSDKKVYKTLEINNIVTDNKGNFWIGTDGDGLFHFNTYQKKFETFKVQLKEYPNIENISSFQFLKDKDSTLLIGSKYGVIRYSHLRNSFKLYKTPGDPLIYTITRDKNNTIWAGGFTSGLLKYNELKDKFDVITKLPDNDVIEIIPIDHNTLWVCTWSGGIFKYDISKNQFEKLLINNQQINRARTSLVDNFGNIWLGTDEGVYKISKEKTVVRYKANDDSETSLASNRIFSIKEDQNNNIWFGTSSGLTKLDIESNTTKIYSKQKGLPNDFIYTILLNNNQVWVSTNHGLSTLDIQTEYFTNYTINDGLQNNEFNGKAAFKDKYGNFYFAGIGGVNIFNPNKVKANPHLPNVYIESVDLFNTPINKNEIFKDTLQFKSEENVLTINYAAINYLNPEKCNYTYMLEGFDADWRTVTKRRSTTYTNLDPGTYNFKVKASNDVGVWNNTTDQLTLIIIPPWYKTTAFKILSGLFIFLSIPIFYLYKNKKLKRDNLKLERIVSLRTEEISLKNKDLEIAYKNADEQRKNIKFLMRELTHRVKNNLQIISSLLNIQANQLTDEGSIDALKVAKNRILTISYIENKIATEKGTVGIDVFIKDISNSVISALSDDEHLKFKVKYNLEKVDVDNINTTMIGLILNELITNTTKYAFEKFDTNNELIISCTKDNDRLKLVVKDNGKGYSNIKATSKNSLGLELVNEMVDQLNGTIQINSTNGTENIIKIPL